MGEWVKNGKSSRKKSGFCCHGWLWRQVASAGSEKNLAPSQKSPQAEAEGNSTKENNNLQ